MAIYDVNYDDKRFKDVENEKQNEPEITENFLKKFFKALINLIKNWLNS